MAVYELQSKTTLQTKMPAAQIQRLKAHAAQLGKPLQTIYEVALRELFEERKHHLSRRQVIEKLYNPPPLGSAALNVVLDSALASRVDETALADGTPRSRLLYTSLLNYMIKRHLMAGG